MKNIDITPSTKVHDLLIAYPEFEDKLISIAPPFKKLKNPILRNSIGKIATIKNIASVAGIPLDELINKIRTGVGQKPTSDSYDNENYFKKQPNWYSPNKITLSVNEAEQKNHMAIVTILQSAKNIKKGEIIELITTFLPAPGIDMLKSKGYSAWSKKAENGLVKSYFLKNSD